MKPGTAHRLWLRVWPLGLFQLLVIPAAVVRARALNFGFPVHAHPAGIERYIFFTWPTDLLQAFLLVHPVMLAASYIYGSWFLVPIVGAIPLMLYQPERYWRFVVPLAAIYWACVPFYALYPLAPPWMYDANIVHVLGAVFPWAVKQDFNPYAPMPSLHVALPVGAALWYGLRQRWGRLLWAYAALISLTVVYSGDHYVADVAGGFAIAWMVHVAMRRLGVVEAGAEQQRVEAQLAEAELNIAA